MVHQPETSTHTSQIIPAFQQGADLFFQAAIQYGYRYVFGNPGTTETPFMDALVRYPQLQFSLFLQENSATGAADGIARMTGWPAIVNLHLGPGLANALANIHNARRAQVPMLITVGDHHSRHLIEDSPLASDIEGIARTQCKWTWTVKEAGELADALYRATIIAMTPPQGPVCLILPSNILTAPPLTVDGQVPEIPPLHLPVIGQADSNAMEEAIDLLFAAKNPLLVIGDIDPTAYQQVAKLAQASHTRIVFDLAPRRLDGEALPESNWLPYFPDDRRKALARHDLIFLVGNNSFTPLFLYEYDRAPVLAPGTQVIHLTDDITALGKNERGNLPLYGNLTRSLAYCVTYATTKSGNHQYDQKNDEKAAVKVKTTLQTAATEPATGPIRIVELMQALRQELPENTILVDEAITARQPMLTYLFDAQTPITTYLGVRGAAIGGGIPLAVGAQCGAPQRPVIVISGDGSAMYTIQSLWSAAHYHLPLLIVICNNASYDIIKLEFMRLQGRLASGDKQTLNSVVGLGEPRLNFAEMAEGMGVRGWSVQDRSELLPAVKIALATCAQGKPALLDVHLHPGM
ncbi:MAG TPA: thiamine pyrophosphate-binding protein [Dictyobacter sp.]|nr:thiamine pyrophosphate-binding protein [Dictyobacter sp.]